MPHAPWANTSSPTLASLYASQDVTSASDTKISVPEAMATKAAGVATPMNTLRGHPRSEGPFASASCALCRTRVGKYRMLPHQMMTALMCKSLSQGTPSSG